MNGQRLEPSGEVNLFIHEVNRNSYPQKSSTVSNAVIILRLAFQSLDLSFLKNHSAQRFCSGCFINLSGSGVASDLSLEASSCSPC